tara:strand:- start:95757 stop:97355 length:1599 start_codon:yes stop_codon:yes gene_type:complete
MSITKILLEEQAIELQKLAHRVMTDPTLKVAEVPPGVSATVFDRVMSTIFSVMYSHGVLGSDQGKNILKGLWAVATTLEHNGYLLPSFIRRFEKVNSVTNGTFELPERAHPRAPNPGALDQPLRTLLDKIHEVDAIVVDSPKGTPLKLDNVVNGIIRAVKSIELDGQNYHVDTESTHRPSPHQSEFMDAQYDKLSAFVNQHAGTSDAQESVTLYHLSKSILDFNFEMDSADTHYYAVSPVDAAIAWNLLRKVTKDDPSEFNAGLDIFEKPRGRYTVLIPKTKAEEARRILRRVTEHSKGAVQTDYLATGSRAVLVSSDNAKLEAYHDKFVQILGVEPGQRTDKSGWDEIEKMFNDLSDDGKTIPVIKTTIPPGHLSGQHLPTLEFSEQKMLTPDIYQVTVNEVSQDRFSGFLDFDQHYRPMIIWANAPTDRHKDKDGTTLKDTIVNILENEKAALEGVLGIESDIHRTNTGAALYFHKPLSFRAAAQKKSEIIAWIKQVNDLLKAWETTSGVGRTFNRSISDNDLPSVMDLS